MSQLGDTPFIIHPWEVHPKRLLLINQSNGQRRETPPNLMKLLVFLAENHQQVVSRDALIEAVWQGRFVAEDSVNRSIAHLRKLLGDNAKQPTFIKTISKQGYQFLLEPMPYTQSPVEQTQATTEPRKTLSNFSRVKWSGLLATFAIVIMIWLINTPSKSPVKFGRMYQQALSSEHKVNRHPRFSEDGRFVVSEALSRTNNNAASKIKSSIVLRDLQNQTSRVLFDSEQYQFSLPTFSPSGNEIAYLRQQISKDKKATCSLEIYTFKTSQSRQVAQCDELYSSNLSFDRDGKQLFASRLNMTNSTAGLVSIDIDSGKIRDLVFPDKTNTGYLFARLSPSNQRLIFVLHDAVTGHSKIGLYDRQNQNIQVIAEQFIQVKQVVWGQTDNEIYFADNAGTGAGIWYLRLDNEKPVYIYNEELLDFDVSPQDKSFVANINDKDLNIHLAQLQPNGEVTRQILLSGTSNETSPALAPDGRQLAFVADRGGAQNLYTKDLFSGLEKQLSRFESGLLSRPHWSADGSRIAIVKTEFNQTELLVFDKRNKQIQHRLENVTSADWHAGNNALTVTFSNQSGAFIYELATNEISPLLGGEVFRIRTLAAGEYIVQKRKLGALFRVTINDEGVNWQTLPSGPFVGLWQLQNKRISLTSTDINRPAPLFHIDPLTASVIDYFVPLGTELSRENYSFDAKQQRLYHVVNSSKSMALVWIKPMEE